MKKWIRFRASFPESIIFLTIDASLLPEAKISYSNSTEKGIIFPGQFSSIYFLILTNHLFFLVSKSLLEILTKYTTGLDVNRNSLLI